MKPLVLALVLLCSCSPPPLPSLPAGDCPAEAKLPYPPIPAKRTVLVIINWANVAASTANKAIAERDICKGSYDRLRAWAEGVAKR